MPIGADDLQRSWSAVRQLVARDEAQVGGWNRLTAAEMEARGTTRSNAWSAAHSVVTDAGRDERQAKCDLRSDATWPAALENANSSAHTKITRLKVSSKKPGPWWNGLKR